MQRTLLKPKRIYHFAQSFIKQHKTNQRRGRSRQYDDALILTIASVQNLYNLSFRESLEFVEDIFPDIPCVSTFHYRVNQVSPDLVSAFATHLGLAIQQAWHEQGDSVSQMIIDGTGFSFNDSYPLAYLRGTEVRKVQSHVRAIALVATNGKERFVAGVIQGKPYEGEIPLAKQLVSRFSFRPNLPFLGDKGFDSIEFIEQLTKQQCLPCIKVRETHRHAVRHHARLDSKENEKQHGQKRTLIESLFGNAKQKLTSHIKTKHMQLAQTYALLRLALFNMYYLVKVEKCGLGWWVFEQSLFILDIFLFCAIIIIRAINETPAHLDRKEYQMTTLTPVNQQIKEAIFSIWFGDYVAEERGEEVTFTTIVGNFTVDRFTRDVNSEIGTVVGNVNLLPYADDGQHQINAVYGDANLDNAWDNDLDLGSVLGSTSIKDSNDGDLTANILVEGITMEDSENWGIEAGYAGESRFEDVENVNAVFIQGDGQWGLQDAEDTTLSFGYGPDSIAITGSSADNTLFTGDGVTHVFDFGGNTQASLGAGNDWFVAGGTGTTLVNGGTGADRLTVMSDATVIADNFEA